jgi:hypothetical protein
MAVYRIDPLRQNQVEQENQMMVLSAHDLHRKARIAGHKVLVQLSASPFTDPDLPWL